MQRDLAKLANPENWQLVYAEGRDEHVWAYIGPETQPWKLAEDGSVPVWNINGTALGDRFRDHLAASNQTTNERPDDTKP
jgi:hypothetical protein